MSSTTQAFDVAAVSPAGELLVVVEVKNRESLSPTIATALRRNLIVHGLRSHAPYFLLLSQERGFVWVRSSEVDVDARLTFDAPPTAEFSMGEVIDRYLPGLDGRDRLRGEELELLVVQWLVDLANGRVAVEHEPERTLDQLGLVQAIRGTRVTSAIAR